ncbi:MAG: hypothetical protein IPM85_06635 [Chitinophagaceae bacterium]|nr:hypothetical protein [Chitinophagaceae bacterium]
MILFTNNKSSRLDYILEFARNFLTGKQFVVSSDVAEYRNYIGQKINYSPERIADNEIWIKPCSLLFKKEISEQNIECFEVNGYKAFFKTGGGYPFDIFAASFYLLSRYEEYLTHQKDEYGRYSHTNSLAYTEGFLNLPLVNIWIKDLKQVINAQFPNFPTSNNQLFTFIPTYDIDEAWAYKNKVWWRNTGGALRDVLKGDLKRVATRLNVIRGKLQDPYDTYEWLDTLNEKYNLNPVYFFLAANKKGKFDKNISPANFQWQKLVKRHSEKYAAGIHPSWRSGDEPELLKSEITILEMISERKIVGSRQHYIRFAFPETYRKLLEAGITEDYSMGYGSINGFRASVATHFIGMIWKRKKKHLYSLILSVSWMPIHIMNISLLPNKLTKNLCTIIIQ